MELVKRGSNGVSCEGCCWYQPTHSATKEQPAHGICRRMPPDVTVIPVLVRQRVTVVGSQPEGPSVGHRTVGIWPPVLAHEWCGEFKERT